MPNTCKTDNCKRRVYKNGLCMECYQLYLQESILEQLTILNNAITALKTVPSSPKQPKHDDTFIPSIEVTTPTVNQIKTSTTHSSSDISEIVDKLRTLGGV